MGATEILVFSIISFIVAVAVLRWAFGINQILRAHKATIGLLILIAKKRGATKEEIDEVLDKVYPRK